MNATYAPAGYCPSCGYRMDPGACPECGRVATRVRPTHPRVRRRRLLLGLAGFVVLGLTVLLAGRPLAERCTPNWLLRRIVGARADWPSYDPDLSTVQEWSGKLLRRRLSAAVSLEQTAGRERLDRIQAELRSSSLPAWAGEYVTLPMGGLCFRLYLSPKSGYVLQDPDGLACGCRILAHGDIVRWNEDYIDLASAVDVDLNPSVIPARFLIARWEHARCLIPDAHAAQFARDCNAGRWSPFTWYANVAAIESWYPSADSISNLPQSQPKAPAEIAALLLPAPIQGAVIERLPSKRSTGTDSETLIEHHYVRLNVGREQGVVVGLRFYSSNFQPEVPAVVESVEAATCVVRLSLPVLAPLVPAKGSILSTRAANLSPVR